MQFSVLERSSEIVKSTPIVAIVNMDMTVETTTFEESEIVITARQPILT